MYDFCFFYPILTQPADLVDNIVRIDTLPRSTNHQTAYYLWL